MLDEFVHLFTDLITERNARRRRQYAYWLGALCVVVGLLLVWVAGEEDAVLRLGVAMAAIGVITIFVTYWFSTRDRQSELRDGSQEPHNGP